MLQSFLKQTIKTSFNNYQQHQLGLTLTRYAYNDGNNWRRYSKNHVLDVQPKTFKTQFVPGTKPEYMYDNLIVWPKQYRPWKQHVTIPFVVFTIILFNYLELRYERLKKQKGFPEGNLNHWQGKVDGID